MIRHGMFERHLSCANSITFEVRLNEHDDQLSTTIYYVGSDQSGQPVFTGRDINGTKIKLIKTAEYHFLDSDGWTEVARDRWFHFNFVLQ